MTTTNPRGTEATRIKGGSGWYYTIDKNYRIVGQSQGFGLGTLWTISRKTIKPAPVGSIAHSRGKTEVIAYEDVTYTRTLGDAKKWLEAHAA